MSNKNLKANKIKIIVFMVIVFAIIILRIANIQELLSFQSINENIDNIRIYISNNYIFSAVLYIIAYTLVVTFALPLATVFTIGAGFFFGVIGVLYVVIGATFGAVINFALTRYLIGDKMQSKYSGKLDKLNSEIDESGANYLLTLRLMPLFPFVLINIAAGLSNVKIRTFIWTTFLGIIPGTTAFVILGRSLKDFTIENAKLSPDIFLALGFVGLMALLPIIYKKYKKNKELKAEN